MTLSRIEGLIAILRAGRVADQAIAWACDILSLYATATAYEESLFESKDASEAEVVEFIDDLRGYFRSLPADRYPITVGLAVPLTTGDGDERFEFGLDLMIRGLEAHVVPA